MVTTRLGTVSRNAVLRFVHRLFLEIYRTLRCCDVLDAAIISLETISDGNFNCQED